MKASEKTLSELHSLVASTLIDGIKDMKETGIIDTKILSVATKFLHDNNIECTADDMRSILKLDGIELPEFEADEDVC